MGELADAEADARLVASAWAEFPSLAAFIAAGILGQTLVARGELEQAEAALDELGDGLRYPGFPNSVVAVARGGARPGSRRRLRRAGRFHAGGRGVSVFRLAAGCRSRAAAAR